MTNHSDQPRAVIRRGSTRIEARTEGDRIIVTKRKLKHTVGEGYQPVGPSRVIYEGDQREAVFLADVLLEVFESDE